MMSFEVEYTLNRLLIY